VTRRSGPFAGAVDIGVDLIDTADSYGPFVSEDLIAEALYPYPDNLVITTKGGLVRSGPHQWAPVGRPEYLRQCVEMSLRRLRVECIDLYQFHRPDRQVPVTDSLGALRELQEAGKIRFIGLSNFTPEQLAEAQTVVDPVTVQNRYNITDRAQEDVLGICEARRQSSSSPGRPSRAAGWRGAAARSTRWPRRTALRSASCASHGCCTAHP